MLSAIDLFAGAGGTGLGLQSAGFSLVAAVEIDASAALTYERNLRVPVIREDIRKVKVAQLRAAINAAGEEQLDLLAGCPPCQGFTRLRNRSGAIDERNDLVLRYLDFVKGLRPRFALFENVPGLIRTKHGTAYYERLVAGLDGLGYSVREYLVDAADFGVPQRRERLIVIAGLPPLVLPELVPTHGNPKYLQPTSPLKPWKTVRSVLKAYPVLRPGSQDHSVQNHKAARTGLGARGHRIAEFIKLVPKDGGSRSDVPRNYWLPCHKKLNGYKDVYGRLAWDAPAGTITGGCTNPSKGRFLHPTQNRGLSYREAAALQSFPDEFVFLGSGIAQQIGNAVPPLLAQCIGEAIRNELNAGVSQP